MSTATQSTDVVRSAAMFLVERAERQSGSRMAAYGDVARPIGKSASWLRKFLNGSEAKEPGFVTGLRIITLYSRLCNRVEAEIESERAEMFALKEQADAIVEIIARMDRGSTRTETSSAPAGSAIARINPDPAFRAFSTDRDSRGRSQVSQGLNDDVTRRGGI